jgi:hypothetical protein
MADVRRRMGEVVDPSFVFFFRCVVDPFLVSVSNVKTLESVFGPKEQRSTTAMAAVGSHNRSKLISHLVIAFL